MNELTVARLHGILSKLIDEGFSEAAIVVEDDGGLSPFPNVVWHPRWATHNAGKGGQLEIVKGSAAIRGSMLFDAYENEDAIINAAIEALTTNRGMQPNTLIMPDESIRSLGGNPDDWPELEGYPGVRVIRKE